MNAHLVPVVSLPAVVTLQMKGTYMSMNCKSVLHERIRKKGRHIKKGLRSNNCSCLFPVPCEREEERKKKSFEIAISVNTSASSVARPALSAKFRSVFMPNVLKRILFAVGQRAGVESTCEPTTSSSNFPLHYLVPTASRFIPRNLVYDHPRDCIHRKKKKNSRDTNCTVDDTVVPFINSLR